MELLLHIIKAVQRLNIVQQTR